MSFREAHGLVAQTVRACGKNDDAVTIAAMVKSLRPGLRLTQAEIEQALDPEHFVRIRRVIGGPAPEVTAEALDRARGRQQEFEAWITAKTAMLDEKRAEMFQTLTAGVSAKL
jgi:argininosuccinate lyase